MAMSKCYGCTNRNTADHPNPDCHTERCEGWKEYREMKEKEYRAKQAVIQAEGLIADGYNRSKTSWLRKHQNNKQSIKFKR